MTTEETTPQRPDLVFPFNPDYNQIRLREMKSYAEGEDALQDYKTKHGITSALIQDLRIDDLFEDARLYYGSDAGVYGLFSYVLHEPCPDERTAKYRLDVIEELVGSTTIYGNLLDIRKCLTWPGNPLMRGDQSSPTKYFGYKNFWLGLQKVDTLEGVQSEGLQELQTFLQALRDHEGYISLDAFMRKYVPQEKRIGNARAALLYEEIREKKVGTDKAREEVMKLIPEDLSANVKELNARFGEQQRDAFSISSDVGFYLSSARYFGREGYCKPIVHPKGERRLSLKNARDPFGKNKQTRGRPRASERNVGNDFFYNSKRNMFVITGPNDAGKTTAVRTLGLVVHMASRGLYVPAESAELSLVDRIFTNFVKSDDIHLGDGQYKQELRRMSNIIDRVTPYSLVLLDEPCGGTSSTAGAKQSLTFLDAFHYVGCAMYMTTHIRAVAQTIKDDTQRFPAAQALMFERKSEPFTIWDPTMVQAFQKWEGLMVEYDDFDFNTDNWPDEYFHDGDRTNELIWLYDFDRDDYTHSLTHYPYSLVPGVTDSRQSVSVGLSLEEIKNIIKNGLTLDQLAKIQNMEART